MPILPCNFQIVYQYWATTVQSLKSWRKIWHVFFDFACYFWHNYLYDWRQTTNFISIWSSNDCLSDAMRLFDLHHWENTPTFAKYDQKVAQKPRVGAWGAPVKPSTREPSMVKLFRTPFDQLVRSLLHDLIEHWKVFTCPLSEWVILKLACSFWKFKTQESFRTDLYLGK